jgi:hypothetical protein
MRLCILGNSHAGCLHTGWLRCKSEFESIKIDFFASRGGNMSNMELSDGSLIPGNQKLLENILFTSGGLNRVDIMAYDAFLVYGLGLSLPRLSVGHSIAVRQSVYRDIYQSTLACQLAKKIRHVSSVPVFVGHAPQHAMADDSEPFEGALSYREIFDEFCVGNKAEEVVFVEQPSETLAFDWFTQKTYSTGSKRLNVGDAMSLKDHPEVDTVHMNDSFGELFLKNLFGKYFSSVC